MTLAVLRGETPPTQEDEAFDGNGWDGGSVDENGFSQWELPQDSEEDEDDEEVMTELVLWLGPLIVCLFGICFQLGRAQKRDWIGFHCKYEFMPGSAQHVVFLFV